MPDTDDIVDEADPRIASHAKLLRVGHVLENGQVSASFEVLEPTSERGAVVVADERNVERPFCGFPATAVIPIRPTSLISVASN